MGTYMEWRSYMKFDIGKMKQYISLHPVQYGDDTVESLLEMFYQYYTEENPMVSEAIYERFSSIRKMNVDQGEDSMDSIFYTVCQLCLDHERLAFFSGFRTGAQWTIETF